MRVLFDHHVFSWQKYGGVSKYFVELIRCLRQQNVACDLPFLFTKNYHLKAVTNNFLHVKDIKGVYHISEFFNRINSRNKLRRGDYDLFHPTSTDRYILPDIGSKPFVITVHDLTIELFPEYFTVPGFVENTIEERTLLYSKAARLIAISHNTKKDLIKFYNIAPEKIDVIYHGYSPAENATEAVRDFPLSKDSYLLYVGSRKEYKNFSNFLIAASTVAKDQLQLVCVGGGGLTSSEKELIRQLNLEGSVFQYDVNSSELNYLYQNALLFIYPSLYEGFGIPILEAFANECPVALSKIEVFGEIAGAAAEYFDPMEVESIRSTIAAIVGSEEKRAEMVQKGKLRLRDFTWEATAAETLKTYELACAADL